MREIGPGLGQARKQGGLLPDSIFGAGLLTPSRGWPWLRHNSRAPERGATLTLTAFSQAPWPRLLGFPHPSGGDLGFPPRFFTLGPAWIPAFISLINSREQKGREEDGPPEPGRAGAGRGLGGIGPAFLSSGVDLRPMRSCSVELRPGPGGQPPPGFFLLRGQPGGLALPRGKGEQKGANGFSVIPGEVVPVFAGPGV